MDGYETLAALADDPVAAPPAGHRHLRRRRARQRRPLPRDGRGRLPPEDRQSGDPRGADRVVARPQAAPRRGARGGRPAVGATNEVLAIMSRSAFDLQVVLEAVVRAAVRLCRADYGVAYVLDGDAYRVAASAGGTAGPRRAGSASHPIRPGRDSVVGRVALIGEALQLDDVLADREYLADAGPAGRRLPDAARRADPAGRAGQRRPGPDPQRGPAVRRRRARARDRICRAGRDRHRQRPAARDDRAAAWPARPLPLAAGRRARLEPGGRGDAGRPPPRDHGHVLRPPELHDVLRDGRAGGGPRLPAALPRDGRRRWSSSTRGRSSTSPATGSWSSSTTRRCRRTTRPGPSAWRSRSASGSSRSATSGGGAATSSRSGIGIATGYATMGRIGFEGRYDYGGVGNAIILASRLSSEAAAGEILIAQRTFAAVDGLVSAEPAGERQLKGFSRPMPVYRVDSVATDRRRPRRRDRGARDRRGDVRQPRRDDRRRPRLRRRARRHLHRGGRAARRRAPCRGGGRRRPTRWSCPPTA